MRAPGNRSNDDFASIRHQHFANLRSINYLRTVTRYTVADMEFGNKGVLNEGRVDGDGIALDAVADG